MKIINKEDAVIPIDTAISTPLLPQHMPGLDLTAGCHRLGGKEALYCKLLDRFSTQHGDTLKSIRSMLESGNHTVAAKQAHALAGVAENLSMVDLAKVLRQLQRALHTDSGDVTALLMRAERALCEVLDSIRKLGRGNKPVAQQSSPVDTARGTKRVVAKSEPLKYAPWIADMEEIKALLNAHDLRARRRFAEVIAHISEPVAKQRLQVIGQQIEGLHFAAALRGLSQVLDSWGVSATDEDIACK